jgi:hypothetical protein
VDLAAPSRNRKAWKLESERANDAVAVQVWIWPRRVQTARSRSWSAKGQTTLGQDKYRSGRTDWEQGAHSPRDASETAQRRSSATTGMRRGGCLSSQRAACRELAAATCWANGVGCRLSWNNQGERGRKCNLKTVGRSVSSKNRMPSGRR